MGKIDAVGAIESHRGAKAGLVLRLSSLAEALADQLEKRKAWFLAGFSILYLAVTCLLASYKLLWNDELYTLYISRLSSLSDIWSALLTGAEQLPPFFYMIRRPILTLFGVNELMIRLPEVIGFWIMCICLFQFVSRRAPAVYGFLAMLFPLVTEAYRYAYEARPYGLVLGLGGLALLCWQSATERGNRQFLLASLALSLAAAVSCHYYAVFIFLPLAFGEAVRSFSLRRLDLPVWLAFGIGATPLIGFLPLIRRAMGYSSTFWSKPEWGSIPKFYAFLLAPAVLPLMAVLVLAALYPVTYSLRSWYRQPYTAPPPHEVAAVLGFMVIPIVIVTLSMCVTGSFTDRYALPAVIGFSIIVAFGAHSLLNDRAAIAAILTLSLGGFFISLGARSLNGMMTVHEFQAQANKFLQSESMSDLPIAVSDQHDFMMLAHYGSPDIASRVVYLADPDASLRYLGHNSVEKGLLALRPWFPVRVEEYQGFIASKKRFLVYGSAGQFQFNLNWIFSELAVADLRVKLLGRRDVTLLFLVSPKD
jgi:hypothetical protein